MNLTVKRLHQLTKAELASFKVFLGPAIRADVTGVCPASLNPDWWGPNFVDKNIAKDADGWKFGCWVGFVSEPGPTPTPVVKAVGVVMGVDIDDDDTRQATMLAVDPSYTLEERFEIADAVVKYGMEDILSDPNPHKRMVWGSFPSNGFAPTWAKRVGFRGESPGKVMEALPNPMMMWKIGIQELRDNIVKLGEGKKIAPSRIE